MHPDRQLDESDFLKARDLMIPRGPDGAGFEIRHDENGLRSYFGHRRLSIQDLSAAGHQPMPSHCGRYLIVYNGEVYNAPELRRQLEQGGVAFRSSSDTEVILQGFVHWGNAVVAKLNGMFAFVIYDSETGHVFAARDRVGIKPFYWSLVDGAFAFASDLRCLIQLGFTEDIDVEALSLYLSLGYVPGPRSIARGVSKLSPGHFLEWQQGGAPKLYRYWTAPEDTDFAQTRADIDTLIEEVVQDHLLSDVPLGLFLSAGLDSSTVAASVGKGTDVTALTASFPKAKQGNEAPIAERTARLLGLRVQRLEMGQTTREQYQWAAEAMDEPIGYSAVVTQAAIAQMASMSGLKVVLTGDGGDEVFAGYNWYNSDKVKSPKIRSLDRLNPVKISRLRDRYNRTRLEALSPAFTHAQRVFAALRPDEIADLLSGITEARALELIEEVFKAHDALHLPDKRRQQRLDLGTFCCEAIMTKVDRGCMRFGVEARPPLLDHRIVEWGLSHPVTDSFDSAPKAVLRKFVSKRGLDYLLSQPKQGFSVKGSRAYSFGAMRRRVDQSRAALGISSDWRKTIRLTSDSRSLKNQTLFWLAEWAEMHWDRQ